MPLEKRHRNEGDAAVLAHLEDRHNVIMLDGGLSPGFPLEAGAGHGFRSRVGEHHLEGDLAEQAGVLGLEDHAHAAFAQQAQYAIAAEPAEFVLPFRRRRKERAVASMGLSMPSES